MIKDSIKDILEKIDALQKDLWQRYDELAKKYGYEFAKKKVQFQQAIRDENRRKKTSAWRYLLSKNIRFILSMPFIYGMIIPAFFLDITTTLYQYIAFRLYKIPLVKRSDYIIFERKYLDYLNWIEKINCLYCSYVNGLFAYCVEVAARTERFWCPIKAASKPRFTHAWYTQFADYGNPDEWKGKSSDQEKAFFDSYGEMVLISEKNQQHSNTEHS